ncbi:hypothetical protein ig2599ANME_1257 [groundwater metagenome]
MAIKRMNYFKGEFLQEQDFKEEQQYHVDMLRLHNKNLHTWGIADGLDVTTIVGEKKITVSKGMAVDALGRQIALVDPKEVDLSTITAAIFYLTISYNQRTTEPREDAGIRGDTRITEEPNILYPETKPADPLMQLILAKVTLNPDKTVKEIDLSERTRAGVVAGDLEATSIAFSLPIAKNLWPKIKGVGTGGLGIDAPGGANFSGALTVGGNAGIGTASPESKLHVSGGDIRLDANRELLFKDNGQIRSLDNNHRILFRRTENKLELREFGDIVFSPGATAGAETAKVVMLGNGNVGIGTTSPGEKLEIVGNLKIPGLDTFLDFGSDTRQMINLWGTAPNSPYGIGVQAWTQYSRTAGNFAWYVGGTHSDVELDPGAGGIAAMIIKRGTRNVGIGTTNPQAKLHVNSNAGVLNLEGTDHAYIQWYPMGFSAGRKAWLGFGNAGTTAFTIQNDAGRMHIYGTELLYLLNKSGVIIGKEWGGNGNLSVQGNIYGQLAGLDVADNFTATVRCADFTIGHSSRRGSPGRALVDWKDGAGNKMLVLNWDSDWPQGVRYYGTFSAMSSRELKENITDLSHQEALETLEKLTPIKFNLKADDRKLLHLGFIAEDAPDMVATPDKKAISNNHIVAVLTKVMKEQQKIIKDLDMKVKILEEMLCYERAT